MRAETLRRITPEWDWEWLDTDIPLRQTSRLSQSLAFRIQRGKGVSCINHTVAEWIRGRSFDLTWVDKAVFLTPETVGCIRKRSRRLVHFTPDTAFYANRSRYFERTINLFDLLVTTKSFELREYQRRLARDTLLLTTQGYDAAVHFPRSPEASRRKEAIFIGLAEPERERCVSKLLDEGIPVRLAGRGWTNFLRKHRFHPRLTFEGQDVFGDDYANLMSHSWVGLGLLSKKFPELHTTRTFEIPACGAILATESTSESSLFFSENEAVFFKNYSELAARLTFLFSDSGTVELQRLAAAGYRRVRTDGREYSALLRAVLSDPRIALDYESTDVEQN